MHAHNETNLEILKMSPSYENYVKYGWDINIS